MKSLVILPTYNEKENINAIIPAVRAAGVDAHILVVDDNSPDGTGTAVRELMRSDPGVHLLMREKKAGLGKAYLAGFRWGLDKGYEVLVQMDADFSHRPEDLKKLLSLSEQADALVGSRYVAGGGVRNWSLFRRLISQGGSLYSRYILGFPLRDWTGGFNLWHRRVLEAIQLDKVSSEGYCFQIELKYRASLGGFKVREVPILFENRIKGVSKMSSRIFIEALYRVWTLRYAKQ